MENNNTTAEKNSSPISKEDNRTAMGILSYLGPLVIVSYLVAKDDPFVKFHIKQGLVLLTIDLILWILTSIFWPLFVLVGFINLGLFILAIIGIMNVLQKKEKELPLVGQFASYFKF